jgi:hypothetical protein
MAKAQIGQIAQNSARSVSRLSPITTRDMRPKTIETMRMAVECMAEYPFDEPAGRRAPAVLG